jgi:hypothetical protein
LYQALLDAAENGVHTADTIVFGPGMSNETFHAGQTLTLSQDVTIDGDIGNDGNADVTISGGGSGGHRLFTITSGFTVTLDSLNLTYGHEAGADAGDDGSAGGTAASVAVNCGTLTIANSLVLNNRAEGGKGVDKLDGGAGHDLADFSDMSKSVELTLKGKKDATVKRGGAADDKVRDFESVTGGMAGDKLTGDKQANLLSGEKGSDTLVGGKGIDTLKGGLGMDKLTGGKDSAEYVRVRHQAQRRQRRHHHRLQARHRQDRPGHVDLRQARALGGSRRAGDRQRQQTARRQAGRRPPALQQEDWTAVLRRRRQRQACRCTRGDFRQAAGRRLGPYGFPDRLAHAFRSQQGHNP